MIFSRSFLLGLADRAVRSFAQGLLLGWGTTQLDVFNVAAWKPTLGLALGMAVLSILTTLVTGAVRRDGSISGVEVPAGKVVALETRSGLVVAGGASPQPTGTPVNVEANTAVGLPDDVVLTEDDPSLDNVEEPEGFDDGAGPVDGDGGGTLTPPTDRLS